LADHFGSLDALMDADQGELENIDQIGPTTAKSIYEYFRNPQNHTVIKELLVAGVKPQQPKTRRTGKTGRQNNSCYRT
jgi:DNA ligase (NAD+)